MPDRYALRVAGILALVGLFTCWQGTPLIWDGAYQLAIMLREQKPYFFEGRFHSFLVWLPVVPLSRVTSNVQALQFVFGLPFVLAPAAGVALSWWIVRRHAPHLVIWPIFGIAAATLPGQIFIINDSIFQQHLFWPVFMSVFVPVTRGQRMVLALPLVFQYSHAIGLVLLGGAAVSAAMLALVDREDRKRLAVAFAVFLALALLALGKIYLLPDSYAASEATWEKAWERWDKGVAGWPIRGVRMMWAAGALLFFAARFGEVGWKRVGRAAGGLAIACAAIGVGMWVYWASDEHRWALVIDFRRWVVPLTAPFFFLAVMDRMARVVAARMRAKKSDRTEPILRRDTSLPMRAPMAYVLSAGFAAVLGIQTVQWVRMSDRLMAEVRAYPGTLVPHDHFPWSDGTALQHWATVTYVMLMQGQTPQKLIAKEEELGFVFGRPAKIVYASFGNEQYHLLPATPGELGWIDHRPAVRQARIEAGMAEE